MRVVACISALLLLTGLSGCSEASETPHDAGDPDPANGNATVHGLATAGAGVPLAITMLSANITSGAIPLQVEFTFNGTGNGTWSLDADGDGTPDANGTGMPANHTHTFTEAGNYTAVLSFTDGNGTVNATLTILAEGLAGTPEGGHVESSTAGATAQAIIGRTPFTLTQAHARLDIIVVLEDPMASELGESYTVRLTPPGGGDQDYTTTNGATITLEEPAVGEWEIGVFMVVAGAYDWSADYCGYTDVPCG